VAKWVQRFRAQGVDGWCDRILRQRGLNSLKALEPAEPVRRYECEHPGELIHIDIKKLGRIDSIGHRITGDRRGQSYSRGRGKTPGWEFVHVCIDDASRVAFVQIMPDQKKESAVAFLKAAVVYYESLGVGVARVMTDNGDCRAIPRWRIVFSTFFRCMSFYTARVIFDRGEAGSKSRHVGYAPESGSEISVLASATMDFCGLMATPGA
jgi:hypothetical protein